MPHAVVCASTASMSARIRHEWPDRLWTVRILRPRKGGIRTCFRSPTGRGNSLRNCPVRVRTPAKAPAETRASTPPIQVLNAYLFWERYVGRPSVTEVDDQRSALLPLIFLRNTMSTPPPARCHIGTEWNDGQGAGLHLSGLNRTASPASYPQHGFVFQPIGCPFRVMRIRIPSKHDGPSGHMRNAGFRMGAVCGRWHEPVAGQAFLCSHGPSTVPHAGTVPPS